MWFDWRLRHNALR